MTWNEISDYLREINVASIILRITLSMLLGGILGSERGRKNRPAGFRTFMLVSVGATLVMMTNQYVYAHFSTSDLVRMGAQVISGIGFLGAGTIIVTGRNQVRGITTAASLWAAACCGLAIGIGFYEGAVIGGVTIFIIMVFMQRLDDYIHSKSKYMGFYIEFDDKYPFSGFLKYAVGCQLAVSDIEWIKNKQMKGPWFGVMLTVKSKTNLPQMQVIELLEQAPGVLHVETI